jgi:hypothetical protein
MTYACPAWELATDAYLLKLQRLKTRFSAQLEIFQSAYRSAIFHTAFNRPYAHDYTTKL